MKCIKCKRNDTEVKLPHLNNLCKNCFSKVIEKRVRKYIRVNKLFSKNDNISVEDPLSIFFIKKIIKDLPVKFVKKKIAKKFIKWTLDDEIAFFLDNIFNNKKIKFTRKLSILRQCTDEELELFAKFNKLSFVKNKKNEEVMYFINEMNIKYPETKFSLLKTADKIKDII